MRDYTLEQEKQRLNINFFTILKLGLIVYWKWKDELTRELSDWILISCKNC